MLTQIFCSKLKTPQLKIPTIFFGEFVFQKSYSINFEGKVFSSPNESIEMSLANIAEGVSSEFGWVRASIIATALTL